MPHWPWCCAPPARWPRPSARRVDWQTSDRRHEVSFLETISTDDNGTVLHFEFFSLDDLNSAVARLIELHADDELPPERGAARRAFAAVYRDLRIEWADDGVI